MPRGLEEKQMMTVGKGVRTSMTMVAKMKSDSFCQDKCVDKLTYHE